jgi:hypothetical protein
MLIIVPFFFGFVFDLFPLGLDLTHIYPIHLPTLISTIPTLILYLSSIDIATLIISYPTDLATVLTTYLTNLATLFIIYSINLISPLI